MRKIEGYFGMKSAGGIGDIRKRFISKGIENSKEFLNLQNKFEKELRRTGKNRENKYD